MVLILGSGQLERGLKQYFEFYNQERLHQSLNYQTPFDVHFFRG